MLQVDEGSRCKRSGPAAAGGPHVRVGSEAGEGGPHGATRGSSRTGT